MSDITMCTNTICAAHKSCARYTNDPQRGQVVYAVDPPANEHGSCEHFMANDQLEGSVLVKHLCAPDDKLSNDDFYRMTHNAGGGGNTTRKYYTMQHRLDNIEKSKQVEFFERKLTEARRSTDLAMPVMTKGNMFESMMLQQSGIVPGSTVEATESGIHIVVMASTELVALAGLVEEMHEVVLATY